MFMKIRTDFVTNSSSVSYIVSWSPEMAEFIYLKNNKFEGDAKKNRIYNALVNDLKNAGKKIDMGENTVIVKKYGFMKKTECMFDESFNKPTEEIDFSSLTDDDLWAYIRGEYLVKGRLALEFKGFGAVQVPRNLEAFNEKFCKKVYCDQCPRKNTPTCHNSQPKKSQ
jgi:hypothetical protein